MRWLIQFVYRMAGNILTAKVTLGEDLGEVRGRSHVVVIYYEGVILGFCCAL